MPVRTLRLQGPPRDGEPLADLLLQESWQSWCQVPTHTAVAPVAGPSVDVARLMHLHSLAAAASAALLVQRQLAPSDEAALLDLWPALQRLAAVAPGAHSSSPFAAAASVVLAQRAAPPTAAPVNLTLTAPAGGSGGVTLQFELAGPVAPEHSAELQVFTQQVSLGVEQSSKQALEDTLSEISGLPSATAMVRSSIEGQQQPEVLASLRSMLLRRSESLGSQHDSMHLRTSLTSLPPLEPSLAE